MFLIQLASAEDKPKNQQVHHSPGAGMVLRGVHKDREANLQKRHETFSEMNAGYK